MADRPLPGPDLDALERDLRAAQERGDAPVALVVRDAVPAGGIHVLFDEATAGEISARPTRQTRARWRRQLAGQLAQGRLYLAVVVSTRAGDLVVGTRDELIQAAGVTRDAVDAAVLAALEEYFPGLDSTEGARWPVPRPDRLH
ncbi:MAG: hypothetical protein ACE147_09895 [Candidatus Methylomirabilales bacterium]